MLKTKLIFLFSLLFFLFPYQTIFADSDKEVDVEVAITEVYFPEKITFLMQFKQGCFPWTLFHFPKSSG